MAAGAPTEAWNLPVLQSEIWTVYTVSETSGSGSGAQETMATTTYLCGGINGLSDSDCRDWREVAKLLLKTGILDPMRRDYRGREDESVKEIVLGDLVDIQSSDYILVNATRPSWGTAMEVHDAASRGLPVIAWVGEARVSPWLRYFCKEIHATLEGAVASINRQAE